MNTLLNGKQDQTAMAKITWPNSTVGYYSYPLPREIVLCLRNDVRIAVNQKGHELTRLRQST